MLISTTALLQYYSNCHFPRAQSTRHVVRLTRRAGPHPPPARSRPRAEAGASGPDTKRGSKRARKGRVCVSRSASGCGNCARGRRFASVVRRQVRFGSSAARDCCAQASFAQGSQVARSRTAATPHTACPIHASPWPWPCRTGSTPRCYSNAMPYCTMVLLALAMLALSTT